MVIAMGESPDGYQETRRTVLKYIGLAAGVGLAGGPAVTTVARPTTALDVQDESFTPEDVSIESFDGTEIAATMYEPAAEGPHPAVLMTHGWGGSRGDMVPLASAYASREFVVLAYDSRGFGESGGEVNSTGPEEQQDASALITWLAGRDSVLTDGEENPRIGMDGISYGGGVQLRTAAHDDRLDAIVPRATWHNNAQALVPNDVVKCGWLTALALGAQAGTLDPEIEQQTQAILNRGSATEDEKEFYRNRSPVSYPDIETPTLFIQEWTDQLFRVNQGIANFRKVQESGAETALILSQDGTHIIGHEDSFPPGSGTAEEFTGEAALQWLTAHLKGDGDHDLAPVTYYDEQADEFVEAQQYPPEPEQVVTTTPAETIELRGEDPSVATVDIPVEEQTEIVGTPTLTVDVEPTGEGRSHLMVALQRVSDGEAMTIKQQVTPMAVPEAETMSFDLTAVQRTFEAGETLRIAMAPRNELLTTAEFDAFGPFLPYDVPEEFDGTWYINTSPNAGIRVDETATVELSVPASAPLQVDDDDGDDTDAGDDTDSGDDSDNNDDGTDSGDGGDDSDGTDDGGDDTGEGDDTGGADDEDDDTTDNADDGGPGLGVPAALSGAGGLAYLLSRRLNGETENRAE